MIIFIFSDLFPLSLNLAVKAGQNTKMSGFLTGVENAAGLTYIYYAMRRGKKRPRNLRSGGGGWFFPYFFSSAAMSSLAKSPCHCTSAAPIQVPTSVLKRSTAA